MKTYLEKAGVQGLHERLIKSLIEQDISTLDGALQILKGVSEEDGRRLLAAILLQSADCAR